VAVVAGERARGIVLNVHLEHGSARVPPINVARSNALDGWVGSEAAPAHGTSTGAFDLARQLGQGVVDDRRVTHDVAVAGVDQAAGDAAHVQVRDGSNQVAIDRHVPVGRLVVDSTGAELRYLEVDGTESREHLDGIVGHLSSRVVVKLVLDPDVALLGQEAVEQYVALDLRSIGRHHKVAAQVGAKGRALVAAASHEDVLTHHQAEQHDVMQKHLALRNDLVVSRIVQHPVAPKHDALGVVVDRSRQDRVHDLLVVDRERTQTMLGDSVGKARVGRRKRHNKNEHNQNDRQPP